MTPSLINCLFRRPSLIRNAANIYRNEKWHINMRTLVTLQDVKKDLMDLMGIERGYRPLQHTRDYLLKYLPQTREELPPRGMQDSFCEAFIPLSSDIALQEKYVTFLGHVRLGRLMEDMDMFAVWVASKHIVNPRGQPGVPTPYVLVTVLVDQIDFSDVIAKHDLDIRLSGHVSWVGRTSLEIVVWLEQDVQGQWAKLTRAIFLMAARNSTNTDSALINPLKACSEYEQKILDGGQERYERRKRRQQTSLTKHVPDSSEQHVIHNLFLKTADLSDPAYHRHVLPPNSAWMNEAQWSSLIFCHPEDRNLHNKVFGGFLMRQALELGWTACYLYTKFRPRLIHIADIGFFKAVDVGSLLNMHAHITYTDCNYVLVLVRAEVLDPNGHSSTTNNFSYIFALPQEVKKVIPRTYHEFMLYVEGRRTFLHVMGLDKVPGGQVECNLPTSPAALEKK